MSAYNKEPFIAVILYESSSDAASYQTLYEESFVLVFGLNENEAQTNATQLASQRATSFKNDAGKTITWSVKQVLDVAKVLDAELGDGAGLYSRHFRDYAAYRSFEPLLDGSID